MEKVAAGPVDADAKKRGTEIDVDRVDDWLVRFGFEGNDGVARIRREARHFFCGEVRGLGFFKEGGGKLKEEM